MDFSKRIVARRMTDRIVERAGDIGLSQSDIANSMGINRTTVSGWFKGSIPSPDHLIELRKVLRCSQDYLEGTTSIPGAKTETELMGLLDKVWQLNGKVIATNAVLIPHHQSKGEDKALVFPTQFISHVKDASGLQYDTVEGKLVIFDSKDIKSGSKRKSFMLSISGIESLTGDVYLNLDGKVMANIHGESADLQKNKNISVLGRVVFTGNPS